LRVDPAFYAAGRLGKNLWVAQGVGEQRTSLLCGEQVYGCTSVHIITFLIFALIVYEASAPKTAIPAPARR